MPEQALAKERTALTRPADSHLSGKGTMSMDVALNASTAGSSQIVVAGAAKAGMAN
jgi:hypothetical protein